MFGGTESVAMLVVIRNKRKPEAVNSRAEAANSPSQLDRALTEIVRVADKVMIVISAFSNETDTSACPPPSSPPPAPLLEEILPANLRAAGGLC
eukprot:903661-Prorocentrum_minimum.AAC.1